jgi:hypothetical protein
VGTQFINMVKHLRAKLSDGMTGIKLRRQLTLLIPMLLLLTQFQNCSKVDPGVLQDPSDLITFCENNPNDARCATVNPPGGGADGGADGGGTTGGADGGGTGGGGTGGGGTGGGDPTPTTQPPIARKVTQTYSLTSSNKVDVLFIVDNSGSMGPEQASMANKVQNMLNLIQGMNYHVAVTNTDPNSNASLGGDGRLMEFDGIPGTKFLTNTTSIGTANTAIANTIQMGESGSGQERGILITHRVIERALNNSSSAEGQFLRADAALAVVLISDEDECSGTNGVLYGDCKAPNNAKDTPTSIIEKVTSTWPGKPFNFHSIVTVDQACVEQQRIADNISDGAGGLRQRANIGTIYKQLSLATESIIGNVCASDYTSQLNGIGTSITQTGKVIQLNCAPAEGKPIIVTKDGTTYADIPTVAGAKLMFNNDLQLGNYSIEYYCY